MVRVLPYTTQVPELMSIADFVVTKPGGLTSTESLVSGLPMVLINPIPGQEEENAQFLESAGVGIWLHSKENYDEIITELLNDENKLNQMRKNTELLAKKIQQWIFVRQYYRQNNFTHMLMVMAISSIIIKL